MSICLTKNWSAQLWIGGIVGVGYIIKLSPLTNRIVLASPAVYEKMPAPISLCEIRGGGLRELAKTMRLSRRSTNWLDGIWSAN